MNCEFKFAIGDKVKILGGVEGQVRSLLADRALTQWCLVEWMSTDHTVQS